MRTPSRSLLAAAGLGGFFLIAGASTAFAADADPKIARLWKAKCASCHGADGKADTSQGKNMATRDMTAAAWQKSFTDAQIKSAISDGFKRTTPTGVKQEMEGFKDKIEPDKMDALVKYIRGLGPAGAAPAAGGASTTTPAAAAKPATPAATAAKSGAPATPAAQAKPAAPPAKPGEKPGATPATPAAPAKSNAKPQPPNRKMEL